MDKHFTEYYDIRTRLMLTNNSTSSARQDSKSWNWLRKAEFFVPKTKP